MLARQTAIYLAANVFSAAFGFVNIVLFTRMFAADAFGDYLLGFGFATVLATVLTTSLKLTVMRDQARGDGTDVRALVLAGLVICCLTAPIDIGVARLAHLKPSVAVAAVALALMIAIFETGQEVLRAEQKPTVIMRGIMVRAVLVSVFGIAFTRIGTTGSWLLLSSALGYALAAVSCWRLSWGWSAPSFDAARLGAIAKSGLPLTVSLSLLALSTLLDRFLIAGMVGSAAAGHYGASLDLVRQSLIIPAISVASAFVPMTVNLLATRGPADARLHLEKCLELLLAITLPACIGFAIVSPEIADLTLGPDFRQTAREAMPILSMAVIFQILTQQYLHTSFLLSNRNAFYLVNTGSILAFNIVCSLLLIRHFGVMGAVWGRLVTEVFGFANAFVLSRIAFAVPFPAAPLVRVGIAVATMALVVRGLDILLGSYGPPALLVLLPAGVAAYGAVVWLLNIANARAALPGAMRAGLRLGRQAS